MTLNNLYRFIRLLCEFSDLYASAEHTHNNLSNSAMSDAWLVNDFELDVAFAYKCERDGMKILQKLEKMVPGITEVLGFK